MNNRIDFKLVISSLLFYIGGIFLFGVILLSFFYDYNIVFIMSWLYLSGSTILFLRVIIDKRYAGISYLIYFFYTFFIGLGAFFQVLEGVFPWRAVGYSDYDLANGYLAISMSLLIYVCFDSYLKYKNVQSFTVRVSNEMWDRSFLILSVIFLLLIPFLGISSLLSDRELVGGITDSSGIKQQLIFMGRSISLMFFLYSLYRYKLGSYNFILVFFYGLIFFVYNYPPALPRFQLLGALVAVFTVFFNFSEPKYKFPIAIGSVLMLLYIFPSMKVIGFGGDLIDVVNNIKELDVLEYLIRVDFDGFMQVVDTIIYLEDGDYRYGINFLGVLLFFVPRALWEEKPWDSGGIVSEYLGYYYNNVSSPLVAEALISFGWFGVLFIFCFLAYLVHRLEKKSNDSSGVIELVLYSMTVGFITIILRGALNGVAPQFATAFLVFFVILFFSKLRVSND